MQQLSRILVGKYQGEDLVLTCRYVNRRTTLPVTYVGRDAAKLLSQTEVSHG